MYYLYHDTTGLIHLATAMAAMVFGTLVLLWPKGTRRHKQIGYAYALSMIVMLITSFMIMRLFNGFGLFHYMAIVSSVTLAGGMIPALLRKPKNWVVLHFAFMYWSVVGLYAAFVAEALTRIPETPFFGMLGISIFVVIGLANVFWYRKKKQWSVQFGVAG